MLLSDQLISLLLSLVKDLLSVFLLTIGQGEGYLVKVIHLFDIGFEVVPSLYFLAKGDGIYLDVEISDCNHLKK